jgi:hypothetical protein
MKILYWTQLSIDNNQFFPVCFFHPDIDLLSYINKYGYSALCRIKDTNIYDGFHWVKLDIATRFGNCPSDLDKTPILYSASLDIPFTSYPIHSGEIEISSLEEQSKMNQIMENFEHDLKKEIECRDEVPLDGEKDQEEIIEEFEKEPEIEVTPESSPTTSCKRQNNLTFVYILLFFLLVIIILSICFYGQFSSKK